MPHPPRLAHLAKRTLVVAKLAPTYAAAHGVDDVEAGIRLDRALAGRLLDDLLDATWDALLASTKRLKPEDLLEKVAESVAARGLRPGKPAEITPDWSAFLVLADVEAGVAGLAARTLLESERGRAAAKAGLAAAGRYLATELTRK